MFPLTHDNQNMRSPHHISDFSFPSLSLLIHQRPYQTSQKTSDPFLKPAGWQVPPTMTQPMSQKQRPMVLPLGPFCSTWGPHHSIPVSFVPTLEPRHSHLDCKAGHTPTTHVNGHVPPMHQPCVHMPAFLVRQRPHVTPTA